MSTLIVVPTTVKLCRLLPSFFTMNGRVSEIRVSSTGWMSWKWLSTATTTKGPTLGSGAKITLSWPSGGGMGWLHADARRASARASAATNGDRRTPGPLQVAGVRPVGLLARPRWASPSLTERPGGLQLDRQLGALEQAFQPPED